jgi:hypothetical protein
MTTIHNFTGTTCEAQRCREADGWQCAECGHYFGRSRVHDIGGEYYCRTGMGHEARGVEAQRTDPITVHLTERGVARIFQALCTEAERLDNLKPAWRTQASVTECLALRDKFAALVPKSTPAEARRAWFDNTARAITI